MSLEQAFPTVVTGSRRLRRAVRARRRLIGVLLLGAAAALSLRLLQPPATPTEPVLVAARPLAAGQEVSPGDVRVARYAVGTAPADAVAGAAPVLGRRVASAVGPGEPVTPLRLLGAEVTPRTPGRVALPVRLPDAALVELLHPGERIDLLATGSTSAAAGSTVDEDADAAVVARDVVVLAVPPASTTAVSDAPGRPVVLDVAADDVPRIAAAAARLLLGYAWSD
ncbi:SAF domain-containing protein [Nocardioides sp. TRM66260-LWL]|uniref:SAF domain-containing protein n=1 Tax=Nocardioides sp. TRM66260-LWL TaxID=2874478 RepID=UPI001CC42192|nr:SAF domain-containing protein [Nocardioides sp. TRM66260-LWL]MBZ5735116.1 SAF domain-containing protein [Nocardioides sp. TRM66260-LWL]